MDTQDKILFLKEAIAAFQMVKRTADAVLEHHHKCNICGSKFMRTFFRCLTREGLAFDYLTAKVDADEFLIELRNIQLELHNWESEHGADDPKLLGWLEGLYKLKDKRSE